ncbi:DUF6458 family protein [Cellulomonas sp.]|uniref:DUF6458 family protein n=1 Tax=Cellulomonas sp. TaxID=40001 RepID=UPI0025C17D21|nr:DUF6458 family protein [Cellulomonas sp.]
MGIGGGIALLVIGAVLAFGVRDSIDAIDLTMIGYICMGAGALALILALIVNAQRSNTSHREVIDQRVAPTAVPTATAVPTTQAPAAPVQQVPVQPVREVPVQQQNPPQAPPAV